MSQSARLKEQLEEGLTGLGLASDASVLDRLLVYLALLQKWNIHNLVAPASPSTWISRHFLDSMALIPVIRRCLSSQPQGGTGTVLDIGSGAGFPGLALAIVERDWQVCVLDARRRRCIFMQQVVWELKLDNAVVRCMRAEDLSRQKSGDSEGQQWPVVTARAVAPLESLLLWSAPLLRPNGFLVVPCGPESVEYELPKVASYEFKEAFCYPLEVPGLSASRWARVLQKLN
ncbi:MAG: 16S rRNA (guanine(527)-N(7))-methyltransferase RsmG [Gammaproteobacteria bacterium]